MSREGGFLPKKTFWSLLQKAFWAHPHSFRLFLAFGNCNGSYWICPKWACAEKLRKGKSYIYNPKLHILDVSLRVQTPVFVLCIQGDKNWLIFRPIKSTKIFKKNMIYNYETKQNRLLWGWRKGGARGQWAEGFGWGPSINAMRNHFNNKNWIFLRSTKFHWIY